MTKRILLSDVRLAKRLINAGHVENEIVAALAKRGIPAAKASQLVRYLRRGLPVRPELVAVRVLKPTRHLHYSPRLQQIRRPRPANKLVAGLLIISLSACATAYIIYRIASGLNLGSKDPHASQVAVFKHLKVKAEKGETKAQYQLGDCYLKGAGVPENAAEAVKWYRKAADQGHAGAQVNLACCYAEGQGVPQHDAEAAKWYRKAADQGHAEAQLNLAYCYAEGQGIRQDYVEAVRWYRKAADQGNVPAQCSLGWSYDKGRGVPQDHVQALKWYRKAAKQGSAEAQFQLGFGYDIGEGAAKDTAEAVKWYRQAANRGHPKAQSSLGRCYYLGHGVAQDYVESHKWLNLAGTGGDEMARDLLARVEGRMTSKQIAEAQRRTAEFKATLLPRREPGFRAISSGSGFFITEDGLLVTNEHVVKRGSDVSVRVGGEWLAAVVVKVDATNDLALLKVRGKFASLPIAPSGRVKVGDAVATVGFPDPRFFLTEWAGMVSRLAKGQVTEVDSLQLAAGYFQTDVPSRPGNSGGALVDERGNVVGVVARGSGLADPNITPKRALAAGFGYAVKSSYLLRLLESLPDVSAKLKEPGVKKRTFEDVAKSAEQATVNVLVY